MAATSTRDVVDLLDRDHRTVEEQFTKLDKAEPKARGDLFAELVHLLVSHEVAEEMTIYPAIRTDAPNGPTEADERIKEQSEAEKKLAGMEKLDPATGEFGAALRQLRSAVLDHAEAEEEHVFPLLRAVERPKSRKELAARYQSAKEAAPTHPHPHSPDTPPGNMVLGPVAALFDKARDAARRA